MTQRKGIATITIVGVLVAILAAATVWYFVSDVFQAKVDSATNQATSWTPEQIAKDPTVYLDWLKKQTEAALQSLKAREIEVAQNKGKLDGMKADAAKKVETGDKALAELKKLFQAAELAKIWPVEWNGQKLDRDALMRQIKALFTQTETQRQMVMKVDSGLRKLDTQTEKIADAKVKAQDQLAQIEVNKGLLKINALTDDIKNNLVKMNSALQGVVATAETTTGTVSLEQLSAETAKTVDTAEFDKIMGQIK